MRLSSRRRWVDRHSGAGSTWRRSQPKCVLRRRDGASYRLASQQRGRSQHVTSAGVLPYRTMEEVCPLPAHPQNPLSTESVGEAECEQDPMALT
jgi:hypothetical protein